MTDYDPWNEHEIHEFNQWMNTEPGIRMRLKNREDQLTRLLELNAPEMILDNQRRLIKETQDLLGENNA
jgi:hypothetical protein